MGLNASALVGYAVLRANYDAEANSYLDNFQKFIICALDKAERDFVENQEISRLVSIDFGISIPTHVVPSILKRTRRSGLTELVGQSVSKLTPRGKQTASETLQQIVQYNRTQTELVSKFQAFVAENFTEHSTLISENPDGILSDYFDRHSVPIVDEGIRGQKSEKVPDPGVDFLVSAFLADLSNNDQVRFNYAVEAAKGAMLAAMLTLDTTGLNDSLGNLTLVLDTPVLMEMLGFHGDIPERSMKEIIDLAKSQSAKIVTFLTASMKLLAFYGQCKVN